ncbi:GyrI-like domain-containing protein [Gordonia sp. CPCC 205515]|uniref:GyrI-like domain-containing protein n=1 Tax=Gordonia sp. CPCC 205515 TaxID=3140791 RepID=UPI003AF3953E
MDIIPEVIELESVELAVVRKTVVMEQIPNFYDEAFPLLLSAIEQSEREVAGPAYGLTFSMPTQTADGMAMDMGAAFPVDAAFPDTDSVVGMRTPGGKVARHVHRGSYDLLPEVYAAVFAWIGEQGLTPGEFAWEVYVTEPTPDADPDSMVTEVVVPVT